MLWVALLWAGLIVAVAIWRTKRITTPSYVRIPLKAEHRLLICLAVVSVALSLGMPLAFAPQRLTTVETRTVARTEPYLVTSVRYETRTLMSAYTFTHTVTSFYTTTHITTSYVTTVLYPQITGFYGLVSGVTTVIPTQLWQTRIQTVELKQTRTIEGRQTLTLTQYSVMQHTSLAIETVRTMATAPYFTAIARSYTENLAWLAIGIVLPILAYQRINAYRSRLHIYYEIMSYAAYSSRLPSHIMRACNLETRKFQRYIQTLAEKGFVEEVRQDGGKLYRTSRKGLDLIREEKLAQFVRELP